MLLRRLLPSRIPADGCPLQPWTALNSGQKTQNCNTLWRRHSIRCCARRVSEEVSGGTATQLWVSLQGRGLVLDTLMGVFSSRTSGLLCNGIGCKEEGSPSHRHSTTPTLMDPASWPDCQPVDAITRTNDRGPHIALHDGDDE